MAGNLSDVMAAAKLLSLPDVYLRLRSLLDEPDFAMAEIAVVISRDPAITLRLLAVVNSSLYSFPGRMETVSRAIILLGIRQVHDLVLATAVAETFKGMSTKVMDMQRFWRRSVSCAVSSRQLTALVGGRETGRLFVAGLLHDIGHLLMYQVVPEQSQQAMLAAEETNQPLYKVERDLLGFDYTQVIAELMQQWSLPESLREIAMFHAEPDKSENHPLETSLVHLGSLLTRAADGEGIFNEGSLTVAPSAWTLSGLGPEECLELCEPVEQEVLEVMNLIFPQHSLS